TVAATEMNVISDLSPEQASATLRVRRALSWPTMTILVPTRAAVTPHTFSAFTATRAANPCNGPATRAETWSGQGYGERASRSGFGRPVGWSRPRAPTWPARTSRG